MNVLRKFIFANLLIIFSLSIFSGCMLRSTPPDVTQIEEQFSANYEDIKTVSDFLINSGFKSIQISSSNGEMLGNHEEHAITDKSVIGALENLENIYKSISISKYNTTIEFVLWTRFRDVGCGVAYSSIENILPGVDYCTELVPLSEPGWYYYVADYNEWRNGKRPQVTMPTTEQ